jgi:CRP/FNR family cyclic AMP-dependent transcriptional regulator
MPLDMEVLRTRLATLPTETFEPGATILAAGSTTGRVLILREGAVEVLRDDVSIVEVHDPGAVFGELALLLKRPHTADVRAVTRATFRVAEGDAFFRDDPLAALYVATVLAHRLDRANDRLLEIQRRLEQEQHPPGAIAKMIETIGESLRFGPPI